MVGKDKINNADHEDCFENQGDKNIHNHDCDCDDCNEHEMDTIVLRFDENQEVECGILGVFGIEEQEYIALVDLESEGVMLYRYEETEDDFELDNIESQEEYDLVVEVFNTLFLVDEPEEPIQ